MGGVLGQPSTRIVAGSLINAYRKNKLRPLQESLEVFIKDLDEEPALDEDSFDVVFGHWLGDIQPHFAFWETRNHMVDAYTVFAASAVYSSNVALSERIAFLFRVFDLNENGSLSCDELGLCVSSCIRAMSRLAGIRYLTDTPLFVRSLSRQVFQSMDSDSDSTITADEFSEWILQESEVMGYIEKFTNGTDVRKAQKNYQERLTNLIAEYKLSADSLGGMHIPKAVTMLKSSVPEMTLEQEHVDVIIGLIKDRERAGSTNECAFAAAMEALLSFCVVDKDRSMTLESDELTTLFWILNGHEPSTERLRIEKQQLVDDVESESVTFKSWLEHIAVERNVDLAMYKAFNEHDKDHNGVIDGHELAELLLQAMSSQVGSGLTSLGFRFLQTASKSLSEEITWKHSNRRRLATMNWAEMKKAIPDIRVRICNMIDFLLDQHGDHAARYISQDKDKLTMLKQADVEAVLDARLQVYIDQKRISAKTAKWHSRRTASLMLRKLDMDRDGTLDAFELCSQSEKIFQLENDMLEKALKPADPRQLLKRLRRARVLRNALKFSGKMNAVAKQKVKTCRENNNEISDEHGGSSPATPVAKPPVFLMVSLARVMGLWKPKQPWEDQADISKNRSQSARGTRPQGLPRPTFASSSRATSLALSLSHDRPSSSRVPSPPRGGPRGKSPKRPKTARTTRRPSSKPLRGKGRRKTISRTPGYSSSVSPVPSIKQKQQVKSVDAEDQEDRQVSSKMGQQKQRQKQHQPTPPTSSDRPNKNKTSPRRPRPSSIRA